MAIHRYRKTVSTQLSRIAEQARRDERWRFLSIAYLITPQRLIHAFEKLRKDAASGIDGVTYEEYARDLHRNVEGLHERMKAGRYRAQPLRRIYISKENGESRPISIPCLEDKVAQKAAVEILEAIYEQDFLDCSYGFRPGRSQHDALNEMGRIIFHKRISVILEADIRGYFDTIVREQLIELIERRIADGSMLRLIRKWIKVGVIEDGRLLANKTGVGQGQNISPLLANIYLHYVLDKWFDEVVKPCMQGNAEMVRYCDDFVLCFEYRSDAERVMDALHKRFEKFGLTLHPDKTRLIEVGPRALIESQRKGKKLVTFDFLGFTHHCTWSRKGRFTIHISTMKKRLRRSINAISAWCKKHRHDPVDEQCKTLNRKLLGHYQYYGRPTNFRSLRKFYRVVRRIWKKWLNSRTRGKTLNWDKFAQLLKRHPLAKPRITHAWNT